MLWCILLCLFQVKGLEKSQFHKARLQDVSTLLSTGINITGNVCSEAYKSRRRSTSLRVERALIRTSFKFILSKKPSFHNYNSPVDTRLITVSRYWFSITQCHHILMWELENSVTRGETEVHHLVSDIAWCGLIKGYLTLWFCYTSGQKPCTLRAHFTQPY